MSFKLVSCISRCRMEPTLASPHLMTQQRRGRQRRKTFSENRLSTSRRLSVLGVDRRRRRAPAMNFELVLLLCFLVEGTPSSRSGFYVDNGEDQTVADAALDEGEKRALGERLREFLGLPGGGNKGEAERARKAASRLVPFEGMWLLVRVQRSFQIFLLKS